MRFSTSSTLLAALVSAAGCRAQGIFNIFQLDNSTLVLANDSMTGINLKTVPAQPVADWTTLVLKAATAAKSNAATDLIYTGAGDTRHYPPSGPAALPSIDGAVTSPADETFNIFSTASADGKSTLMISTFQNRPVTWGEIIDTLGCLQSLGLSQDSDETGFNTTSVMFDIFGGDSTDTTPIAAGHISPTAPENIVPDTPPAPSPAAPPPPPPPAPSPPTTPGVTCITTPDCEDPEALGRINSLVSSLQANTVPIIANYAATNEFQEGGKTHGNVVDWTCTNAGDYGSGITGPKLADYVNVLRFGGCSTCGVYKVPLTSCSFTLGDCTLCASIDGGL